MLVVSHLLEERLPDTLGERAVDLPIDDDRSDDVPTVVDRHQLENLHRTRLGLHSDYRRIDPVRVGSAANQMAAR